MHEVLLTAIAHETTMVETDEPGVYRSDDRENSVWEIRRCILLPFQPMDGVRLSNIGLRQSVKLRCVLFDVGRQRWEANLWHGSRDLPETLSLEDIEKNWCFVRDKARVYCEKQEEWIEKPCWKLRHHLGSYWGKEDVFHPDIETTGEALEAMYPGWVAREWTDSCFDEETGNMYVDWPSDLRSAEDDVREYFDPELLKWVTEESQS